MNGRLSFPLLLLMLIVSRAEAEPVDYARDVYPILETHCVGCHTEDDPQGGLVMETFGALMKGGESGVAITAGVPNSSRLLLMASGKLEPVMPPDDAEGPSEEELEILARWIEEGALGPEGDLPIKRPLRTPKLSPSAAAKPVTAIARSADGKRIARAEFGRIEMTHGDDGSPVVIDDAELGKVNSLSFSSDATRLLVASGLTGAYGRAALYDVASGKLIREYVGHRDILYDACFSPGEDLIATAGYDRIILLWDSETGETLRELKGHNGAIFDLAFSPDGNILVSACADETAKVWSVKTGQRLDTLSQPEGEVFGVSVTDDGRFIVAGSADNRIRVWRLRSVDRPRINPLVATRFVDETPIVNFALSPDSSSLVSVAESGNIKVVRTRDWQPVASLESLPESATDLFFDRDGKAVTFSMMNGELVSRSVPDVSKLGKIESDEDLTPVYLDLGDPKRFTESDLRKELADKGLADESSAGILDVERNAVVDGKIAATGEADSYRWQAGKGELWAIDVDAAKGSRIDPIVSILDAAGSPVLRVRLQAVRDSYFTFRGKDSKQISDFRVFNWQEMKLGEFLYSAGEVCKLMMHPRGPDSGFNVYPGAGNRWTYFGTNATTHALGEPAYIVRALPRGARPLANGLPVFDITYENDDDPMRLAGKNSRILFTTPADGLYSVKVADTRGEGGDDYAYQLRVRAAAPGFVPKVSAIAKPLRPATGRELKVFIDRQDGFEGAVTYELNGLPDNLVSNFPLVIEPGQREATGLIWAPPGETGWEGEIQPTLTAWAMINGTRVERSVGSAGKLTFDAKPPQAIPVIRPAEGDIGEYENWTLQVRRGETVMARVALQRKEGFKNEVSFGKELAGRNASQGVYVDNIGLNGLLILAGADEREFFLTADETAVPGKRLFHLSANVEGGLTSHPITVEVLP